VEIESRSRDETPLVPREAVIDTATRQLAFVAREAGHFEPRSVRLGAENDEGLAQALEGLSPGETVVTSGQFLLDVESRTQEAIEKLRSEEQASNAGPSSPPAHRHGAAPAMAPPPGREAEARPPAPRVQAPPPAPGAEPRAPAPKVEAGAALLPLVDALFTRYLELTRALSSDEGRKVPPAARLLEEAAAALAASGAGGPVKSLAAEIQVKTRAVAAPSLEETRRRFKPLSDAVIALAEKAPPSAAVGKKLVVVHCPMYPGDWLQTEEKVANPYYGSSMLDCGEVVRTLKPEAGR
jgi:hypothetical protein